MRRSAWRGPQRAVFLFTPLRRAPVGNADMSNRKDAASTTLEPSNVYVTNIKAGREALGRTIMAMLSRSRSIRLHPLPSLRTPPLDKSWVVVE